MGELMSAEELREIEAACGAAEAVLAQAE